MSPSPRERVHDSADLRRSLRRWQWAGVVVFTVLFLAFPLYRAVDAARRGDALVEQERALIASGNQLWGLNCASCHGTNGQGVDAPALNSQQFLNNVSDEQIHHIVAAGITGTEMPAWSNEFGGALTDQQIEAIVTYLRSWEKAAPDRPDWRSPGASHAGSGMPMGGS